MTYLTFVSSYTTADVAKAQLIHYFLSPVLLVLVSCPRKQKIADVAEDMLSLYRYESTRHRIELYYLYVLYKYKYKSWYLMYSESRVHQIKDKKIFLSGATYDSVLIYNII